MAGRGWRVRQQQARRVRRRVARDTVSRSEGTATDSSSPTDRYSSSQMADHSHPTISSRLYT